MTLNFLLAPPGVRLAFVAFLGVVAVTLAAWTAAQQPVTGLALEPGATIAGPGRTMTLVPLDFVAEPGTLPDRATLSRFHARQDRLADLLASDSVTLRMDGESRRVVPAPRGVLSLPALFWVQVFVGLAALTISGWVWALRPRDAASRLFALSGGATLIFTVSAAIYSTRELALPSALFEPLVTANLIGASLFGLAMIALFLIYPVRLGRWRAFAVAAAGVFGVWTLLSASGRLPVWAGVNLITLVEMIGICAAIGAQYLTTRRKPADRAVLTWFGVSVMIGAGAFIALNATPLVLGVEVAVPQGYAFLFFLVIYLGLAAGLRRYQLFRLGDWAFRILFYLVGTILLIALDALLVYVVSIERVAALGLSLLAVAFLYLPLRDGLARRFAGRRRVARDALFTKVIDVALTPPGQSQNQRWRDLMRAVFDPLHIKPEKGTATAEIDADGLALTVPDVGGVSGLRLEYAYVGRKLFSRADLALVRELTAMLRHALESRSAYEAGVAQERERIARDMHDNIGAHLLAALHGRDLGRKDMMIRETLADLREIINDSTRPGHSFSEVLADLRAETAERLAAAGIELDWTIEADDAPVLAPSTAHALRSIIREAVSNVIKHAEAGCMQISLCHRDGIVSLMIEDDGLGPDPAAIEPGNGLANIERRVAGLRGTFQVSNGAPGICLIAEFALSDTAAAS